MLRKELDMRLTAYLPAVVRRHLERQDLQRPLSMPTTHRTTVVSMFADVSGFTAMTESLAARGPVGAEDLAKHLNSYFEQLLRLVSSAGGDVFKFAGDAMLIFWPESKEDTMDSLLRRALQCALRIQSHLHKAELAPGVVLSVKVGLGIGEATIAHLGGESDGATARIEYVAVGPALEQAFDSEHQAEAGDVICSSECWERVSEFFHFAPVRSHNGENDYVNSFHRVIGVIKPVKICSRRPSFTRHDALLHKRMKQYVSRAVWPYLDAHDEFWGSELRDVTVLFINLGFSEQDLAQMLGAKELQRLQDAFALVQKCVYDYEGTINKFLVDDKGSTAIAAFGLSPVTHENDPIRGILSSLAICAALGNTGLKASVGITTGTTLCGVIGHLGNRREYTVLGDVVNLSARLMQRAKSEGGGVITDASTKIYTHDVLHFEKRPEIMVKGKNESIKIHRPYPRMSILLDHHLTSAVQQSSRPIKGNTAWPAAKIIGRVGRANALSVVSRAAPMQNLMENMHRVQVRDAQRRLSLRADRQRLSAEELVEGESFVQVRTALMEKCSHLNLFAPGGAFVLEGDIGVGKTVLIRSALASPEAGDYQVLVGTACPFATKKPYAIWSELITRGAQELSGICSGHHNAEPAPPLSPDIGTTDSSNSAVQAPSRLAETKRRKCVAQFVRQKIRDGAAPNTTLIRYASLLNAILDTDFDAYPDTSDGVSEVVGMKHNNNNCQELEESHTNQSEEETNEENQRQNEEEMRAFGYSFAERPDRTLNVKEEEIASWFLGLLEMDLAQKEEARALLDCSARDDDNDEQGIDEDEREPEWRPVDLDISGILLLCALYAMSRERATVFCLDSAMYMDEKSWVLVAIIAKYFTNCLIVVGTRPPSLALGEHTESSSFRRQLRLLKRMKFSTCASMDTFSSDEIEVLSRQILKVPSIPSNLLEILVSRSQGNPLFLHEIIGEMQEQQVIRVDEKKGARNCELQVQESWGDKYKARFCFACHASFSSPKKDKLKEKEMNLDQGEEAARKTRQRCKCCGYVFCAECTPKACQAKLPGKSNEPVRHCRTCYNLVSSRRPSGSIHGIGATVGVTGDKRTRTKNRLRSIFQPGSGGDQALLLTTSSSKSPPVSVAQTLTNRIALRPPRTVKSVLTTMLDQLTVSQRMLMKTASTIGPVFDKEILRGACPIEAHLSRFAQDLEDLEQLAMIRRIDTFIGGVPTSCKPIGGAILTNSQTASASSHLKVKFEFSHGFMCGIIREQMLRGQLDKLNSRIADLREQQQKELRHKFFSKANEILFRPQQLTIPAAGGDGWRTLTPTVGMRNSRSPVFSGGGRRHPLSRCDSHSSNELNGLHQGVTPRDTAIATSISSSESSMTQPLHESEYDDVFSSVGSPGNASCVSVFSSNGTTNALPTCMRLKASRVVVKKYSSMFSHLKLKGLKNARQWKTRYAVLQNARLLLQYEESDPIANTTGSAPLHPGIRHGTSLSLKGAKVSACDPEVAAKLNCFQVEVSKWMKKGKVFKGQRRSFIIGVDCEEEVENWVYMIRFAIESLESQSQY